MAYSAPFSVVSRFKFFRFSFLAVLGLFLLSPLAFATDAGEVSGTVRTPDGKLASGAQVTLKRSDGSSQATVTDEQGNFQFFPVILGDYDVSVQMKGATPYQYSVHVSSGANAQAEILLADMSSAEAAAPAGEDTTSVHSDGKEMVVQVKAKKRLIHTTASVSSSEISQAEIKKLPQGSQISLPKLITNTTPGVVPGAFGQMFFRGSHASIQYQIDGVQLPDSPSSTFGQAFSPRNIDRMEVITGGIPAEYGQRLAAVVNVVTKSGTEEPSGEAEVNYGSYNYFSPQLMYGGTNEGGYLRYFFSLNYNQTDRGIDTPQPESYDNQFQGGTESIHNRLYGDAEFGRVDWQIDNQNKLIVSAFHSQSNYQIPNYPSNFLPTDPYFNMGYKDQFKNHTEENPIYNYTPSNTNDTQAETNVYIQAAWKHTYSNRSYFQLSPYFRYSRLQIGNDPANDLAAETAGITDANPTSFSMDRFTNNAGIKGDYSLRPNDVHLIKAGFQLQASRADGCFTIQTQVNGPVVKNCDPTLGYSESAYVQDDITVAKPLTFNAGIRFDATQFIFSNVTATDFMFQPRVGVNYMVSDSTKLHAFYGKLFMPAPVENLRTTFFRLDPTNMTPYDIKAEKNDFFEVGVAHQLAEKQVVGVNLYYKFGTNFLDDAQLLRTSIAQPFNFAEGYAYGAEFSLRGELSSEWSEFLTYSYQMAQGRGISGGIWAIDEHELSTDYQVLDHVQEHTANAGITYNKNNFWWTTLAQYGSGLRTGHSNSKTLPSHITFDTTIGYEFKPKSWWGQGKISFDVLNILDNRYPVTIANGFNGNHYAAGRTFYLRLTKTL